MLLPEMLPEPPIARTTSLRVAFRMLNRNGSVKAVQVIPWTVESGAAFPQQVKSSERALANPAINTAATRADNAKSRFCFPHVNTTPAILGNGLDAGGVSALLRNVNVRYRAVADGVYRTAVAP